MGLWGFVKPWDIRKDVMNAVDVGPGGPTMASAVPKASLYPG